MADAGQEQRLRAEYHGQTARIPWHDLQRYFAGGVVVCVAPELDLVEVAVQLGLDNLAQFEQWTRDEQVAPVTDAQASVWYDNNVTLWAVVAAPWVLVQMREEVA